ncbi:hypothetical protein [Parvularcula maris]|uniref:Uncharacterized protein n=1 Tax=Parvularcula maris TaxID=2965077 RepID=A0A9X2L7E1_9PROT|nr:hypothetical protein [Parvularcula maris]MCQ8184407.1 hypothetical protein [Parvularcula maris]
MAAYTIGSGAPYSKAASGTKPGDRRDLGDGFYLVDGWVLSEADLQR